MTEQLPLATAPVANGDLVVSLIATDPPKIDMRVNEGGYQTANGITLAITDIGAFAGAITEAASMLTALREIALAS